MNDLAHLLSTRLREGGLDISAAQAKTILLARRDQTAALMNISPASAWKSYFNADQVLRLAEHSIANWNAAQQETLDLLHRLHHPDADGRRAQEFLAQSRFGFSDGQVVAKPQSVQQWMASQSPCPCGCPSPFPLNTPREH